MLCDWFVDNKLSMHFGEDKTKSILFGNKHEIKNSKALDAQYNDVKTKKHSKVIYLGCILEKTFARESIATQVINKINFRLRLL